ncbi:cytochrome b [Hydrogenophaga sp. 5NK40-0174]|uniref:cytochrome b n=1 Tax=Hydrogenophaga sp. 5NK40-0174 TaxID=3127649 RepID=UPI00310A030C
MKQQEKYPVSMRVLHWLMAIIILGQIFGGWFMTPYDETREPLVSQLYWWHKSFGLLVFMLVFIRLSNRLRYVPPKLPASLPTFDRKLAHFAHWAIYALIVLLPITGYTLSSTFEYSDGITFFGIHVPELFPKSVTVYEAADWLHVILAYTLLAVVALHLAGVVKHRFFDKNPNNDVLQRML